MNENGKGDTMQSPLRLRGLPVALDTSKETKKKGFGFLVAVAFTVNYIMGTGFLTLPFATAQAGSVLAFVALFSMAALSNIAKDYVLESSARAELIENPHCFSTDGRAGGEVTPALVRQIHSSQDLPLLLTVKKRKYEMPTLCQLFLGHYGKVFYMLCLSVYIYGALLAYGTVFANSVAAMFPLPAPHAEVSYVLYLGLFAVLVIPLSCLELTEQISVQVALAFCRVLMVVCMVGSVAAALVSGEADYFPSLTGLSHPVRDKTLLGQIFLATFVICSLSYGLIAVFVAHYFGPEMAQSSNLEWDGYGRTAFGKAVGTYVLLFPALDVASAFPLNAITLGNNMLDMGNTQQNDIDCQSAGPPLRVKTVGFRLLAAVPPLVVAVFVRDLGRISEYAGTVGIVITLVFPALLNLRSRTLMKEVFQLDSARTYYSNELSRKRYGPVNLIIGLGLFFYILVNLLME
ncbi:hypothetical protein VYU27_003693 [Nannochloropsis oceanica]